MRSFPVCRYHRLCGMGLSYRRQSQVLDENTAGRADRLGSNSGTAVGQPCDVRWVHSLSVLQTDKVTTQAASFLEAPGVPRTRRPGAANSECWMLCFLTSSGSPYGGSQCSFEMGKCILSLWPLATVITCHKLRGNHTSTRGCPKMSGVARKCLVSYLVLNMYLTCVVTKDFRVQVCRLLLYSGFKFSTR